jgi:hypothetical protein
MSWLDLPQTKLYPIKKLLISIHWPLAIMLKLSWGGSGPDGMIGYVITFALCGPETIMNDIPSIDDDIINHLDVQFIDCHGIPENVATFLHHVLAATVRPNLVQRYLIYLKEISPHYTPDQINNTREAIEAMNVLPTQLFNGRQIIDNADIVALERIAVGNPAELLQQVDFQIPTTDVNRDFTVMDSELGSVDNVFLNPQDGDESIAITNGRPRSAEECVLDAICNISREGDGETTNNPVQVLPSDLSFNGQLQVPHNLNPLNEFSSNDVLF